MTQLLTVYHNILDNLASGKSEPITFDTFSGIVVTIRSNILIPLFRKVHHIEVNLIGGANRDVSRGFIACTLQICSPASSCLNVKRLGFLKRRLNYYSNCTASFNPSLTTLIQSGDIHSLPGPVQRNICTDIRCMYMNARSLVNKTEEFQTLAVDTDCIFAVETGLKPHVLSCELLPGLDFTIHRRDRSSRVGGGVLLTVNNTIKSFRRKDFEGNTEILACELRPNSRRKILAIVFYRPPDTKTLNTISTKY